MQHYDSDQFRKLISQTKLKNISFDGEQIWDPTVELSDLINSYNISHRGLLQYKIIDMAPFWYINFLLEKNPLQIIDLGCGNNLFKKYIPIIHGIDPLSNVGSDQKDIFDTSFSENHSNQFESVMSINALHFISFKNYGQQLKEFSNIIKPNGRGFITFNVARMKEYTDLIDMPTNVSEYIWSETEKNLDNILVYDDYVTDIEDEYLNGNIRIVFDK